MQQTRTEYLREWRKNNREKVNEYNKRFMKKYRENKCQPKTDKITITLHENGKCASCDILLSSKYANGGNKYYCGDCLSRQPILQTENPIM